MEHIPYSGPREPSWESITIEQIQGLIDRDELFTAKRYAEIRRAGFLEVISDAEAVVEDSGTDSVWQTEKIYILQSLTELDQIIRTLDRELRG